MESFQDYINWINRQISGWKRLESLLGLALRQLKGYE